MKTPTLNSIQQRMLITETKVNTLKYLEKFITNFNVENIFFDITPNEICEGVFAYAKESDVYDSLGDAINNMNLYSILYITRESGKQQYAVGRLIKDASDCSITNENCIDISNCEVIQ